MGKVKTFEVSFNSEEAIYYPGQTIRGHVTVELTDTIRIRGIRLKIKGKASVHWQEGDDSFSAKEKYFKNETVLVGRLLSSHSEEMHAGRHVHPFTFQLHTQLPASFEGDHGYVRYTVTATIDKPMKFDHTTKRPFTIVRGLDLNPLISAATSVQGSKSKQVCCLFCASGPIRALFRLDRRGYVPGETIVIKAEIDNMSNRKINSSSVVMKKNTKFHAEKNTCTTSQIVAALKHGEILKGETDYWNGDQLVIPHVPPSFLIGCKIIDVDYTLELRVDPSGPAFDLVVPLQVIVGTVPLLQVMFQFPRRSQQMGWPMLMSRRQGYNTGVYNPVYLQDESIPTSHTNILNMRERHSFGNSWSSSST